MAFALTDMSINEFTSRRKKGIGHASKELSRKIHLPRSGDILGTPQRIPKVNYTCSSGTPTILERDQSGVIGISATQVKRIASSLFGFRNRLPKQERRPAQIVVPLIRAAILVNKGGLMPQSKNSGHGLAISRSYTDLESVAQAGNEISKPLQRLWWQPVSPAGLKKQAVKLSQ